MDHPQYLPAILARPTSCLPDPPVRRRNHSLTSAPDITPSITDETYHYVPPAKKKASLAYTSKKSRIFKSNEHHRIVKDPTKLCQESMAMYMDLRKELSDVKFFKKSVQRQNSHATAREQTNPEQKPKLTIKTLNLPQERGKMYRLKLGMGRQERELKAKCKTEVVEVLGVSEREKEEGSIKKYKEMSLREIVESEEEFDHKVELFRKIRELRETIQRNLESHRVQEYERESLRGW